MKNQLRFSNFAGTKLYLSNTINDQIQKLESTIYVEPFVGSGAAFFNLPDDSSIQEYYINDSNPHLINCYRSFQQSDYQTYSDILSFIEIEFGNIKQHKESYYNFRNYFNTEYFSKNKDLITEGFMFHILMNSCINSMPRLGKMGFNQAYGARHYKVSEEDFAKIHIKLQKATITCGSYEELFDRFSNNTGAYIFLDPPYFVTAHDWLSVKNTQNYSSSELGTFIHHIANKRSKIAYTDIYHEEHEALLNNPEWTFSPTKIIRNISPQAINSYQRQEVCFINF